MSIAGRRSSLGDEYQLRVALHWLIRLLEDNTIESIQVDSTGLPGENSSVTVDDIVILYKNGHACFIQAKKNQTDHKAWSFSDKVLKDELCKAREQIESRANSKVIFYSRSPFGELASLVENCGYFPEYSAFHREADEKQRESLKTLAKILGRTEESTYFLVKKITFGSPQGFEEWDHQNKSDLARVVPKVNLVIPILERYLVSHETNLRDSRYVITRSNVLAELAKHGLSPTPMRTEAEIIATFKQASSIGRNWLRTIDGKPVPRSELFKIIELIDQRSRCILLTDGPGSGKTCVLLDLADYIEREKASVWELLFVKGDKFTNVSSEQELTAHSLPEDIVGQCARLADYRQLVVIIDSLDVLSLSRQHSALKVFLGIIDRLEKLDGVTVIVACRNFDLEYDPLLRGRSWQHKVNLQPLDFDNEVKPFLIDWKVDVSNITPELRALLQIPQNLRIYEKLAKQGVPLQPASTYELYNSFIEEVVVKNPTLGTEAVVALQNMAEQLMLQRTQSYSKVSFGTSEDIVRQLISQEVLLETSPGVLVFSHQTLADCLTVRATLAKNQTLAQFILEHPQLPFIRPAVRAFFFYLRAYQPDVFRRQVREVLSHDKIAYHVKRLASESFAEIAPVDQDWRLLQRIFQNYPDLFRRLLWRAKNGAWWNIITQNWLPEAKLLKEQRETWLFQFVQWLGVWMNVCPAEVVEFWREAIAQKWANTQNLARSICFMLIGFEAWDTRGIQELLETLVEDFEIEEYDSLGKLLSRWVQHTNSGDILLWRYITKDVSTKDARGRDLRNKLRCQQHKFCQENFLEERLNQSDVLITQVLKEIENWSEVLYHTSWGSRHSQGVTRYVDNLTFLFASLENALKFRARINDAWWQTNEPFLRTIDTDIIRYFVIEAYKENIEANIPGIENQLRNEKLLHWSRINYELGELLNMAYPYISETARLANQTIILSLCTERKKYEKELSYFVYQDYYNFLVWIPCIFRTPKTQVFIDTWQNCFGYVRPEPDIRLWGGTVMPPLSTQSLLNLSDDTLFRLLHYYAEYSNQDAFDRGFIGGLSDVKQVLCDACSINPARFITLLPRFNEENLYLNYICALVRGIAYHLRYRFGNVRPPQQWEPIKPLQEGEKLAYTLLNWLERYFIIWEDSRTVRDALEACCDVLTNLKSVERLSLLLFWLYSKYPEDKQIRENSNDLASTAINSVHGVAAESAIKLCNKLLEKELPTPEMLLFLLRQAAHDKDIYVRVPILEHLHFLIYKNPDFGWQLLADVFKEPQPRLWKHTELCFYYQYHNNFDKVAPYLTRLLHEGMEEAGDIWGRISTLASLAGHISQEELFKTLSEINSYTAWKGATQVFTTNLELEEHTEHCVSGLITVLRNNNTEEIIRQIDRCFEEETKINFISPKLAFTFLEALTTSVKSFDFHGFLKWLGYQSRRNPLSVLELTEALSEKLEATMTNGSILWHTEPLIVALNEILREADDTGDSQLIQRAINLQDRFLRLDVQGIEELLNKAGQE